MKEPISVTHPDVAAKWHPTKNGDLTPDRATLGSNRQFWWKCPEGPDHEWKETLNKRALLGYGCPFCSGHRVSAANNLAFRFPEMAAQWHPTKNEDLTPDRVTAGSREKVWWKCPEGPDHEWEATVAARTCSNRTGTGCPFCAGKMVSVTNSLAFRFPEIAAQWHSMKNGDLTPDRVVAGSHAKVWWKCPGGPDHEWEAPAYRRTGCPFCAGRMASATNSLASLYAEIAAQWHPTKNAGLTPDRVAAGSSKKFWWKCPEGSDHEWEGTVTNRTLLVRGCPFCSGKRVSATNNLAFRFPGIAAQWHPTKNANLTPDRMAPGSPKKVWWKCPEGPDHEWEATLNSRTSPGRGGCPFCSGKRVSATNNLAFRFPEIAAQWHPTKNGDLTPAMVVAGSARTVWWKCTKAPDHEWEETLNKRTSQRSGCPFCSGRRVSAINSLAFRFPEMAAQWHPTKNGELTPDKVTAWSHAKVWWRCPEGLDHEWESRVSSRTSQGGGCPFCSGKRASATNNLAFRFPEMAAQWHPTKNGELTPDRVVARSNRKVWWKCPEGSDHEWEATLNGRTSPGAGGCPYCSRKRLSATNNLAFRFPEIATQWHPTKNGDLTPDRVVAGSAKKVWWKCPEGPDHEWKATVRKRTGQGTGCPFCTRGWRVETIRVFVASLKDHLRTFTPAELYVLFRQSGLLQTRGKGRGFVSALATGRFPPAEIDKFVKGEPSMVDDFVQDPALTLEAVQTDGLEDGIPEEELADAVVHEAEVADEQRLPVVETKEVLASLDHRVFSSADEEAVEFLLASAVAKLWKHAFRNETEAVEQAQTVDGTEYAERVRSRFLEEYGRAKRLRIPDGYVFRVDGKPTPPNLMQRYVATRLRDEKRVGNWSGTGAGKTLSAILASRVIGASLTVVCCPNSSVDGWRKAILEIFPNSVVATKTFDPGWAVAAGNEIGVGPALALAPRYLILNYEAFQQPDSAVRVMSLVGREPIDFVVVDEIHFAKQRALEDMSRRRRLVTALTSLAAERNPDLCVLGMSATPVINNLQEGKSMVELVTGVADDELDTHPTVSNCMALHQQLATHGVRWMPEYNLRYRQLEIEVDCGEVIEEIKTLGRWGTPLALEQILTRVRLPTIREHIQPKTLIYTHYVERIDRLLRDALVEDGWKVGFYTGEDKCGLDGFLKGDVDVLIGSLAVGTGVDGLQQVCSRLIVNVLPWTAAEFEQLKGRIYRQGQRQEEVTMVIPLSFAEVNGQRWSWCESKMQRLRFKKSIADAAVDGVVPEGHLRTPAQAYQDLMAWLERLYAGEVKLIARPRISVPLSDVDLSDVERRLRRYGDFSDMNRNWNRARSEATHERLQRNPEEWAQYHTLYREARESWAVVPYEEMSRWCQKRSGYVIGDFGCGEALLAGSVSDRHTVYSFDHMAVNDDVIACDMAHVPIDDETLDVAIYSLSLMGANITDYLREAHRTLKLDGQLHVIEATSRFTNRNRFREELAALGFDIIAVEDMWKFTHIRALKTDRQPKEDLALRF